MLPGPNDQVLDEVSLAATLDELRRVRGLLDACEAILKDVEWEGGGAIHFQCPCCKAWKMQGHELDCALASAIMTPKRAT